MFLNYIKKIVGNDIGLSLFLSVIAVICVVIYHRFNNNKQKTLDYVKLCALMTVVIYAGFFIKSKRGSILGIKEPISGGGSNATSVESIPLSLNNNKIDIGEPNF